MKFSGVNKLCAQCQRDCKQWSQSDVVQCLKFKQVSPKEMTVGQIWKISQDAVRRKKDGEGVELLKTKGIEKVQKLRHKTKQKVGMKKKEVVQLQGNAKGKKQKSLKRSPRTK